MIESDDFPSHLCCWCATRVADAYDLKVQCLKVQDQLSNRVNSSLMVSLCTSLFPPQILVLQLLMVIVL